VQPFATANAARIQASLAAPTSEMGIPATPTQGFEPQTRHSPNQPPPGFAPILEKAHMATTWPSEGSTTYVPQGERNDLRSAHPALGNPSNLCPSSRFLGLNNKDSDSSSTRDSAAYLENGFHIRNEDFPKLSEDTDDMPWNLTQHPSNDIRRPSDVEESLSANEGRAGVTAQLSEGAASAAGGRDDDFLLSSLGRQLCSVNCNGIPNLKIATLFTDLGQPHVERGCLLFQQRGDCVCELELRESCGSAFSQLLAQPLFEAHDIPEYMLNHLTTRLPFPKAHMLADEALFFLFYFFPGEVNQLLATQELHNRRWMWHLSKLRWMWLKTTSASIGEGVRGVFRVFDPNTWHIAIEYLEVHPCEVEITAPTVIFPSRP